MYILKDIKNFLITMTMTFSPWFEEKYLELTSTCAYSNTKWDFQGSFVEH